MILPIKKKWFDMICAGIKTEEYREIKPYYDCRFQNLFGAIWVGDELLQGECVPEEIRREPVQEIIFQNGYSSSSPRVKARCSLAVREDKEEWGAVPGIKYYVLEIKSLETEQKNPCMACNHTRGGTLACNAPSCEGFSEYEPVRYRGICPQCGKELWIHKSISMEMGINHGVGSCIGCKTSLHIRFNEEKKEMELELLDKFAKTEEADKVMQGMVERTEDEIKREAHCQWYNKPLRDVAEHEQDACGRSCMECECLVPGSEAGNE